MATAKRRDWTRAVTESSAALDLEPGVFTLEDPRAIAESLKRSAMRSRRRKSEPFRSAMSMLTFYINRAGRQLPIHGGGKFDRQPAGDRLYLRNPAR